MNDPTDYFACSRLAAQWLFSEKIAADECVYLRNGIDIQKYRFDSNIRNDMRSKLRLDNKNVILNIGRLELEKNQLFLVDIFESICKQSDDFILIIIGKGSLKHQIEKKAVLFGIKDRIIFIDHTFEIEKYMFASDLFVLPSVYEGFGIAAIEAQATGLPTIISDGVPQETAISDLVLSIPLEVSADIWAERILKIELNNNRELSYLVAQKAGYDINESAKILEEFYIGKTEWK